MTKFVALRAKTYRDDGGEDRKGKDAKKCVINLNLKIIKTVWKQLNLKTE